MKRLLVALALFQALVTTAQQPIVWRFDNLKEIGGATPTVLGSPKVVETEIGKAVHFEGKTDAGDALFFDTLPLEGASAYTFEVIFRPSSKGEPAERFFHLQDAGSLSRRMFELRIVDNRWCLDTVSFSKPEDGPMQSGVMLHCDAQHVFPLDQWYAIAAVYDGTVLRGYVNGVLQGEVAVNLLPLGRGGTSVGTRYTKRDYFTGDVFSARFTGRAMGVGELLKVPAK